MAIARCPHGHKHKKTGVSMDPGMGENLGAIAQKIARMGSVMILTMVTS